MSYHNVERWIPFKIFQIPPLASQLKDASSGKDREVASLRRQLDAAHSELDETGRVKDMAMKENRRLQDDLATVARENQVQSNSQ